MRKIGRDAGSGRFMKVVDAIRAGQRAVVETYRGDDFNGRELVFQNGYQMGWNAAAEKGSEAIAAKRLSRPDGTANMSRADYNAGIDAALDAVRMIGRW